MKMRFSAVLSVIIAMCTMITSMSVVSSAVVEITDENFIYGTEVAYREDYNIVPGVTESYLVTQNDDGSNRVSNYILEIDMDNPEIGIIASYKDYMNGLSDKSVWGMQAVRDQAVEVEDYYRNTVGNEDFEVVAGVNGDFFNMGNGAPTGTLVMNGIMYHKNEDWPYFAILDDGSCVIGDRKDKLPKNAVQIIGGPEVLIKDGEFTNAVNTSGYGEAAHPRTAIGIKEDGNIVMLVSDGRMSPGSCGQTFYALAEELLALGCVDALCLDGGGSASFVSQRDGEEVLELRNSPADGIERTVSTALLIYTNKDTNKYSNTSKWAEKDGNVVYYDAEGNTVTGEQIIDGNTYVFDENGALTTYAKVNVDGTLAKNQWVDTTYYLGEDGLAVRGSKKIGNVTFTFNAENGKLQKADIKNRWYECDSSVCYFDADGKKVTGSQKIGGYTYKFDKNGKLTTFASVKDDGTLVKKQWIGKDYYLGENGLPVTGKVKIDKYTYTFGNDGKLIKGALVREGNYTFYYIAGEKQRNWFYIDGAWRYFDRQTGFGMATSANSDKGAIDFDKTDGLYTVATTDAMLLFKFDSEGRLIKGAWLETDYGKAYYWGDHKRLVGWQVIEKDLYFFNNDTYAVTGKQIIADAEYTFNSKGMLQAKSTIVYTEDLAYEFNSKGKVEHIYKVEKTELDCTTDAKTVLTCVDCGVVKTEITAVAQGHSYVSVVTPPTIEEQGFTTHTCTVCNHSYTDNFVGAIGHDYEAVVTPPTCTEKGYTTYSCKTCDDKYVADYVDATGHDYVAVVTAPTCTEKGYTTYTCNCGDSYVSDYVGANGHLCVAVVTPPTCTEKGYTTFVCECGYKYIDRYTDPAHSFGVWEVVIPSAYDKEGLEKRICKGCGYAEERAIPVLEIPSDEDPEIFMGDLTNDGKITAMDARLALRIAARIDVSSDEQLKIADFNGDGKVTAMDARLILRKAARID